MRINKEVWINKTCERTGPTYGIKTRAETTETKKILKTTGWKY